MQQGYRRDDGRGRLAWLFFHLPYGAPVSRTAAASVDFAMGRKGDSPLAINSGLTKWITPASLVKNSRAKVVFPAPFGPAMMMQRGADRASGVMTCGNSIYPSRMTQARAVLVP